MSISYAELRARHGLGSALTDETFLARASARLDYELRALPDWLARDIVQCIPSAAVAACISVSASRRGPVVIPIMLHAITTEARGGALGGRSAQTSANLTTLGAALRRAGEHRSAWAVLKLAEEHSVGHGWVKATTSRAAVLADLEAYELSPNPPV